MPSDSQGVSVTQRFRDKTVVITGASAGIGGAVARAFAREGANLLLVARRPGPLEELADELRDTGATVIVQAADVISLPALDRVVVTAREQLGGIDILVNNAGMNTRGEVEAFGADELALVVDVNLRAPVYLSRRVLDDMRARGGGAIVNVASIAGRVPLAHEAVYSATKFGLRVFSIALAEELRGSGITVSLVSPGPVDTQFIMADVANVPDIVLSQPLSSSEEIAGLVLRCAADGQVERVKPKLGGLLATAGYLLPSLRRVLLPILERQGRRNKARYLARNQKAKP